VTSFIDGPAQGKTLMLLRAPHFLRAVKAPDTQWDALDQLHDVPAANETIVAYEMVGEPTFVHIRRDRRHGGSGCFRGGRYRVVADQPPDEVLRSTTRWREWCVARVGQIVRWPGGRRPAVLSGLESLRSVMTMLATALVAVPLARIADPVMFTMALHARVRSAFSDRLAPMIAVSRALPFRRSVDADVLTPVFHQALQQVRAAQHRGSAR
jgi:hypothetical protein